MTGDQREAWKRALAGLHRQQRTQRGKRTDPRTAGVYRPGMIRLPPSGDADGPTGDGDGDHGDGDQPGAR